MNDSSDEEEDDVKVCQICGGTPCQWIDYGGDEILESLQSKYDVTTAKDGYVLDYETATSVTNNRVRREFYRLFSLNQYGSLGHETRTTK